MAKRGVWLAMLLGGVLLGIWYWRARGEDKPSAPGAAAAGRPVSVNAATVVQQDLPVYLWGLGNVSAYYTVMVKPQVDGRVDKVLFREGQEVQRGELLALIDVRPFEIQLHQAEAALARDSATLRNNKLNLERNKALRLRNLIPQQTLDDQQSLVDQYEGMVMADETQVENARLQLTYAHITAPIAGRTGVRLVDPGNVVHASDPNGLVVITQLDPIAVLFTMPEDDLSRISREMQKATLEVDAFSRDGKDVLGHGTVALIDNQINAATGTMRLKAVFPNPERALWPNQFVKVRLHLRTLKDAMIVPASAIQHGPQGTFAYVVQADKGVALQPVEVDGLEGDNAVIKSGLQPGDEVVTDGQYQLRPGSKVKVNSPGKPHGDDSLGDANSHKAGTSVRQETQGKP